MKTKIFKNKFSWIIIVAFFYIVASIATTFSPVLYANQKKQNQDIDTVWLVGHRGAGGLAPENTLSAIKKGLDIGVDAIEVDIQQSKDSIIFILHDETLDRTTNGKGLLKNFKASELKKFDAGSSFSPKFAGEKIPTLDEAFELINGKATFLIELKKGDEFYPGIEENLVNTIHKFNANDWVIVHSFNTKALQKIHALDSTIRLHKLFIAKLNFIPLMYDGKFHWTNLDKFSYCEQMSVYYKFINPHLVKFVHSLGKKINAWTVDDTTFTRRLLDMGVDGIITNYPDKMKKIIQENK